MMQLNARQTAGNEGRIASPKRCGLPQEVNLREIFGR